MYTFVYKDGAFSLNSNVQAHSEIKMLQVWFYFEVNVPLEGTATINRLVEFPKMGLMYLFL